MSKLVKREEDQQERSITLLVDPEEGLRRDKLIPEPLLNPMNH